MKLIISIAVISALAVTTSAAQQKKPKEKAAFNFDRCMERAKASGRAPGWAALDCNKRMNAQQEK